MRQGVRLNDTSHYMPDSVAIRLLRKPVIGVFTLAALAFSLRFAAVAEACSGHCTMPATELAGEHNCCLLGVGASAAAGNETCVWNVSHPAMIVVTPKAPNRAVEMPTMADGMNLQASVLHSCCAMCSGGQESSYYSFLPLYRLTNSLLI